MLQKLLLFIIIAILSFVVFLTYKISDTINGMNLNLVPSEVEIQAKVVEEIVATLPLVWQNIDSNSKKVFLSYDSIDFVTAIEISKMLEKDKSMSVYLAPKESVSLKDDSETINALNSMDVFIILFSENYEKSEIANQEYGVAIANAVPVVVVSPFQATLGEKYGSNVLQITSENQDTITTKISNMLTSGVEMKANDLELKFE